MQPYPPSYYAATLNESNNYPELTEALSVDTCILGGGYAGLMAALSLIERGHTSIALIEQNRIGWGASGRNGGFVFGGYSLSPQALVAKVGEEKAKALYQMTVNAVDLIRKRATDYQIDCDLVDKGVILANWFKDQSLLHKQQAFMQDKMGVDWQYLSPPELTDLINTERYHGGLFEPNAMHFHPLNYARGVAAKIAENGGQVFESSPVVQLDLNHPEKRVITPRGSIKCKQVLIAGGGYLKGVVPKVSRSILPIATYVMATEPLGKHLSDYVKTQAAIYDTRFAFDYYRPLKDNRLLWGGQISAKQKQPGNLQQSLRLDMLKVFPHLKDAKIEYVWDGMMPYSRHQMAQIGQLAEGVWYSTGFGGHGVAPTSLAGEVMAEAISGQSTRYQKFTPWGLPWNGGPFGPAAAQMSYWWYQTKDWLKDRLEA